MSLFWNNPRIISLLTNRILIKNKKQKIQWDVINRIAHGISDLNHGIKSSLSCVIDRVIFVLF